MSTHAKPQYSRNQVDLAGDALLEPLISEDAYRRATKIINNWRSCHSYPLNSFTVDLRKRLDSAGDGVVVAQRIKRLESIQAKLERQSTQLSQMQDIGGCRGVAANAQAVAALADRYMAGSTRFRHELHNYKDYISDPKTDGYRSFHLIYKYRGRGEKSAWDNLRIEVQLRSDLQHVWATAVETVSTFTKQALKSNQGTTDWKRFFSLMSCGIAGLEGCVPVPGCPTNSGELAAELENLVGSLKIHEMLSGYRTTLEHINTLRKQEKARYFLVKLDLQNRRANIKRFPARSSRLANMQYMQLEKETRGDPNFQIVLVAVDSVAALQRAYPNYFLDTRRFSELVATLSSVQQAV